MRASARLAMAESDPFPASPSSGPRPRESETSLKFCYRGFVCAHALLEKIALPDGTWVRARPVCGGPTDFCSATNDCPPDGMGVAEKLICCDPDRGGIISIWPLGIVAHRRVARRIIEDLQIFSGPSTNPPAMGRSCAQLFNSEFWPRRTASSFFFRPKRRGSCRNRPTRVPLRLLQQCRT